MTAPFFSICIAAYNAERYISECLRSIAAQDCRDYEVVIVDDGSAEPLALDEGLRSAFPSCTLRRTANSGPYAARQAAFDASCGEVVICVDADDGLLDPSALTKIKRAFIDGDVDIVLFNASSSDLNPARMFDFSALVSIKDGAVTGAISMAVGAKLMAPHGGLFVLLIPGAITPVLGYLVAIIAGTLVAGLSYAVLKRPEGEAVAKA